MSTANAWCLTLLLISSAVAAPATQPFEDRDLPAEKRIDDLLSKMTIDEKIAALGTNPAIPRLGVRGSSHVEGLHGLAQGGPGGWGRPNIVPTTMFPQAIGLGQMWNPDLLRRCAIQEAYEARYLFQSPKYHRAALVVRAPNADLGRDPRWGRTEECFGEDPFFNGTMVVSVVRGLQGDDPRYWATASLLKHFLANSNEDDRTRTSSNFDQRLFREYYAWPFEQGIRVGGARAFMASYNSYNGVPCTVNPVLRNVAIDQWGEDGIICTDAGSLRNLVNSQGYYDTLPAAAAGAVKAGINQFLDRQGPSVKDALAQGLLTEAQIDERIRGVYRVMIKLGLLDKPADNPYAAIGSPEHDPIEPWMKEEPKALSREATRQSIVLLKNEGNLLPLDDQKLHSIAIIGPRSFEVLGDWYGGTPPYTVTPIEAIRARALAHNPRRLNINYAPSDDDGGVIYHAQNSDVAIVFVGNHPTAAAGWEKRTLPSYGKEAMDRQSITLEQEELVKRVRAVNPKTIVVLISSFPYAINWTQENVPAILQLTHSSQELGNAVSDVLFGDFNPAGRLVQTWPRKLEDVPRMLDFDIRHGRTYLYAKAQPLYPFGFGLSYSTFKYGDLRTDRSMLKAGEPLKVQVDVHNTSDRAGDEVVQLYVRHNGSKVDRPIRELKAFARQTIGANETKTVELTVNANDLRYWDVGRSDWALETDQLDLGVGGSSADLPLHATVNVEGTSPTPQATSQPAERPNF